jgi:hypothetical protein
LQKKILLLFYYFFAKFLKVFTSILTKGAPFSLINLVLICICSKINAKFDFFIVLFVEMGDQVCTRCKKSRDISLFQGNNNKSLSDAVYVEMVESFIINRIKKIMIPQMQKYIIPKKCLLH